MEQITFESGKMLFFPEKTGEGVVINLASIKMFYYKLAEYVYANALEDVTFSCEGSQNGVVTIWCNQYVDEDTTNIYLVGVMSGKDWVDYGWWEKGYDLNVTLSGTVIHFPEWVDEILAN